MIELDTKPFMGAMKQLSQECNVEMSRVMSWQMALWCRSIIQKIYGDPSKCVSAQQRAGEDAVTKDLAKIFEPIHDEEFMSVMQSEASGRNATRRWNGNDVVIESKQIAQSSDALAKWHTQHRKKNTGRTWMPNNRNNKYAWGGRMLALGRVVDEYAQKRRQHVGRGKSSWLNAYYYFQEKSHGLNPWVAPAWITRHRGWGRSFGVHSANFNPINMTGSWEAGSQLEWGKSGQAKRTVDATGLIRLKDLQSDKALLRLKGKLESHNFVRV